MTIASSVTPNSTSTLTPVIDKGKRPAQGLPPQQHRQPTALDNALAEKILGVLGADRLLGKGDMLHLHVTANGGVATLTGHVMRAISKTRAEAATSATPGVTTVVNHLVADDELTIKVAQALGNHAQTQREQIQVSVKHGVVHLGGSIMRAVVRAVATQIASNISQSRGIVNTIQTPGMVIGTDEESFVQPRIESELYATDSQLGRIEQVVINPQNRRVTAVVVDLHTPGEPPHRVLIPMSSIRYAPSGVLFLRPKENEVKGDETPKEKGAPRFVAFNPLSFALPATDWQPPYPYSLADVLLLRQPA